METDKQLCPSCRKEHSFGIISNNELDVVTLCPNTGQLLKAKVGVEASVDNIKKGIDRECARTQKVRKYIFWLAIITLGFCALMACVDFICGEWIYGIVMVACMILNFFNAKSNANY